MTSELGNSTAQKQEENSARTTRRRFPAHAKPEPKRSKPRVVASGIFLGVLLFALTFVAFDLALPTQDQHDPDYEYGYVYSGAKSQSVEFNTSADAQDSILLFGSSELSTPSNVVPQVPSVVFGENNYGIDLTYVGEAYDQSLWHSMAIGAYEPEVGANRKIVLVLSPTWFEDAGLDESTFKLRFSYSLYRAFCQNPAISQSSKDYLAQRLANYAVEQSVIDAGLGQTPVDELNNAIYLWADDLKLRKELLDVREEGSLKTDLPLEEPDFEALHYQALSDAAIDSTNNAWGMDDAFYESSIEGKLDRLKGTLSEERFANAEELKDFSFLLKICNELNLEPLVIIPPVHGEFYDHVGTSPENRQACYNKIIKVCENNDVAYADFTNREYEKYFLHDIVHFGNTGWVAAEEAIYSFVKGSDDE